MSSRQEVLDGLLGIALVFRFGNPSHVPWSEHEVKTCQEAETQEQTRARLSSPSEARGYFERCGASVMENVCSANLEQRLVDRTVDLVLEKCSGGRNLRSSKEQPFCVPAGNRELYLVSTRSCQRMKEQRGNPFSAEDATGRLAWAVEGQPIKNKNKNGCIHESGGTCMPDVGTGGNHSQNLDNPANQPFADLLDILIDRFGDYLSYKNDDDAQMFGYDDDKHMMMCLQLILAEKDRKKGERGSHQDKWSTTGAAIIGVTLLNDRAMTLSHCKTETIFPLPRCSAYVLSGAARYGTLWGGLSAFNHHIHPFREEAAKDDDAAAAATADDTSSFTASRKRRMPS